jgi:hypothetical protein
MRAPRMPSALLVPLFLSVTASSTALAGLGGAPSTFAAATAVHARQMAASSVGSSTTPNLYTVQETTLEGGTLVREYVDGRGQVFAVSWNGPFMPDLRTLLGAHFAALTDDQHDRSQGHGRGRGPLRIKQQDLVIESGGHMRAWTGRAWLSSALPAGVSAEVIE